MNILVTGGAGYIGSVAVKKLLDEGNSVIVVDNLSKGKIDLVDSRAKFYKVELTNKSEISMVFDENSIDSIIHFAAYKAVGESMTNAVKYSDNLVSCINLLNLSVKHSVKKFVFSSTAAVYGETSEVLTEESTTNPVNFYGFSKLECEHLLGWYNKIHGLNFIALRYFNVAGDLLAYVDPNAQNVFPIVMEVINGKRDCFTIFGEDYDTSDGSGIRDYVDVRDLVNAHILALASSYTGVLNLGSGKGYSVKELVKVFKEESGIDFEVKVVGRRAGDPGLVVASNSKAKEILNWKPTMNLNDMVKSTIDAYGK